jgi:uncharacterized membrane protein
MKGFIMTEMSLYWLTRFDGLIVFFSSLAFLVVTISAIRCICIFVNDGGHTILDILLYVSGPLLIFICAMTPTTKEMAAIIIIPKIYNATTSNEEFKKLPNNILNLANEYIEELKPDKVVK